MLARRKNHPGREIAGLNVNFGLANFAAEVDRTGDNPSVRAKLGFRFQAALQTTEPRKCRAFGFWRPSTRNAGVRSNESSTSVGVSALFDCQPHGL
jgi:hypothetical protein